MTTSSLAVIPQLEATDAYPAIPTFDNYIIP